MREEAAPSELCKAVPQGDGHFLGTGQSDQHLGAEGFTPRCPWTDGETEA